MLEFGKWSIYRDFPLFQKLGALSKRPILASFAQPDSCGFPVQPDRAWRQGKVRRTKEASVGQNILWEPAVRFQNKKSTEIIACHTERGDFSSCFPACMTGRKPVLKFSILYKEKCQVMPSILSLKARNTLLDFQQQFLSSETGVQGEVSRLSRHVCEKTRGLVHVDSKSAWSCKVHSRAHLKYRLVNNYEHFLPFS